MVDQPGAPLRADDAVGWTIVRAARVLAREFEEAMRAHDLTPTQFGILNAIAESPGIGSGELARQVLGTPQAVGQLVGALEEAGLVARDRSQGPGRRAATKLTRRGRARLAAARRVTAALNAPEALGLTAREARALNAMLHRILEARAKETT